MNINSFLNSKKFTSKPSKKSTVRDTLSSHLNDSLTSDYKRGDHDEFKDSEIIRRIDYSNEKQQRHPADKASGDREDAGGYGDKEGYGDREGRGGYSNKEKDNQLLPRQFSFESEFSSMGNKNKKGLRTEGNENNEGRTQVQSLVHQLSEEVVIQLMNVNHVIENFNKKMTTLVQEEFQKFKLAIIDTVDRIFEESSTNFRRAYEVEQEKGVSRLFQVRKELEEIQESLSGLEKEARSHNWKAVSGELASKDVEHRLNQLISQITKSKNPPSIEIHLDRRRMAAYEEALSNILDLQGQNGTRSPYR